MDDGKSFEEAGELLNRMNNESRVLSEVMSQTRKHVTSDDTLRERLTTSIAKVKDLGESSKGISGKLKVDHQSLIDLISLARQQRKDHLVEKRKLQMTLVDAERKVSNSESKLSELREQLLNLEESIPDIEQQNDESDNEIIPRLKSEITTLEKKLIISQANNKDMTIINSELQIKERQVAELREQLALSTTESEQKDETIEELQQKNNNLENELVRFDHTDVDRGDGGSTIMSESTRIRPVSGPPRLERKTSALPRSRTSIDEGSVGFTQQVLPPLPTRKLNLQKSKQKPSPLNDIPPAVQISVAAILMITGFAAGRLTKK